MKIVRFIAPDCSERYGVLEGEIINDLAGTPFKTMDYSGETIPLTSVKLLAPCAPSKIVCLGVNYHGHAREMGHNIPNVPLIFLKPSTAVIGTGADIVYPPSSSRVDYEAELAAVIRKSGWRIPQKAARDHVLGYTCFNDVTARDLQRIDGQWTRAKSFDTFAAVGPWIETEVDPSRLNIETFLNGERKQHGNTSDLIYHIDFLIHFISHVMTLLPGDIIATGTPSGIGPMKIGDTVEVRIDGIGTLRNKVVRQD
ncbi:fumarylacetoacetate hydrolase family protein [Dehalogenimonas sp. 4OHTPN]|uniref:Fumarylacetoacetate hydrolase family protein n=1 Tax=Dehalogenimonas sp. 4OHTPN TaxID=3166643 RepID=A0AAU8G833_9CHLR